MRGRGRWEILAHHSGNRNLHPCRSVLVQIQLPLRKTPVVHVPTLMKELDALKHFDPRAMERVFISTRAHLLFDSHQIIDGILEVEAGTASIGTTKRGIGRARRRARGAPSAREPPDGAAATEWR
ncbi:unnamed protein product, partial [Prorocentrum cordatum]